MPETLSAPEDMPELPEDVRSVHEVPSRTLYRLAYLRRVKIRDIRPYLDELQQNQLTGVAKALYDWVVNNELVPYLSMSNGYPIHLEQRKGKPARVVPGAELPEDLGVLPSPDTIRKILSGLLSDDAAPVLQSPDSKVCLFVQEIVDSFLDLPFPGHNTSKPCRFCGKNLWISYPSGSGEFCGFCHPQSDSRAEE